MYNRYLWTFLVLLITQRLAVAADPVSFSNQIEPILKQHCTKCHDPKVHKADLDLSSLAAIKKGGDSGPSIVAGRPDESPLFEKLHKGEMPPKPRPKLDTKQIELIREWISQTGELTNQNTETLSQHDIIPIMMRRCAVCHGIHKTEAGLDLRTKSGMLKGGKSGPAMVPGKPELSAMIKRMQAGQMPPAALVVDASVRPADSSEIETLSRWIAQGAPEVSITPDVATTEPDPLVSDKDRDFWSFKPPKKSVPPKFSKTDLVNNPIDAFVLKRLSDQKLTFSPQASRIVLIRRVTFDLTGVAPDPSDVQAFLNDRSPNAFEKVIDRLLASPRYGERWARFWLDLAGYADSEGKREQDLPRPNAWRYRDYVIKSLNQDKTYDRFLMEQIAGDELADYTTAKVITDEIADNLVATGFLRMVPDATWANITGFATDRIEVIADTIEVLGSSVMGLSLKCARCHTHKFDPIPHRDYYRLVDVFKGAYDEYDWLRPDIRPGLGPVSADVVGGRLLPHVTTRERNQWQASESKISGSIAALKASLENSAKSSIAKLTTDRVKTLPDVLQEDVARMLVTAPEKRDSIAKYLADKFEKSLRIDRKDLAKLDPGFAKIESEHNAKIALLEASRQPEPKIQALWDRGNPTPTYIYRRGDWLTPTRLVGPGVPSMLTDGKTPFEVKPPWPGAKSTGRRLAFAKWLTGSTHPLTARVAVNRIWKGHFQKGIVPSLDNFGKAGIPPSHPELLDWLACELIEHQWSLKHIHKIMLMSTIYQQSSEVTDQIRTLDPDNMLYSRAPIVRLDAESLYDNLLNVSGRLDERPFGIPDSVKTRPDGLIVPVGNEKGWRRMIYVQHVRKAIPTALETFDYPAMNPNCVERRDSLVPIQALHLLNNGMVQDLAGHLAQRVSVEQSGDRAKQLERIYWLCLSRPPSDREKAVGLEALETLTKQWAASSPSAKAETTHIKALTTFTHAIMNSAAFLYID
jgi:mono/diheme cytochrome c family protein